MKSSDKKIENRFLSNGPFYSLLALYMPVTALAAFIFLIEAITAMDLSSFILIVCGCLSGLAASFYCDFMKDIKSSRTAANIRGGIITAIICYICVSLLSREAVFIERFLPNLIKILACAASLYAWIYVVSLKRIFGARRHFEIYTELYQGEKLQSALFEDSALLRYTQENIDNAQWHYFIQLVIIAILAFVCSILKIHLPLSLYFLLACILTGAVCLFGFFDIMKSEHYYAGEGLSLSVNDRANRILVMILFTVICLAAAIFPASDKSILSFSLITGFFSWLLSLFRRSYNLPEETFSAETAPMEMDYTQAFDFDKAVTSSFWETVSKYILMFLKYGIIVLAAAGFIRFMISPFLNRSNFSKKISFHRRLFRITAEWFKGIFVFFASFFSYLKNLNTTRKLRKYDEAEIRKTAESLFNAYSPAKKSDMKHSVTLFARLILWGGETRRVDWKPTLAPGEYCAILAAASPLDGGPALQSLSEGIIRCGEIFEKALYSAEILSSMEKKEFKDLVDEITAVYE